MKHKGYNYFSEAANGSHDLGFLSNSNGDYHVFSLSIFHNGYKDENSTIKRSTLGRSDARRLHRKMKKYQIGEATDDVRLCIMCLRAIMNNQVSIYKNIFMF